MGALQQAQMAETYVYRSSSSSYPKVVNAANKLSVSDLQGQIASFRELQTAVANQSRVQSDTVVKDKKFQLFIHLEKD